jgi:hypothetical protein
MSKLVLAMAAAALLAPAQVQTQSERTEFETLAKATCSPLPSCALPQRGTITCPGGGEPSPSLMPPWCESGSRTRVRDRMLVYSIVETNDPRVAGTITFRLNMNLDSDSFSGPIWGTYTLEVPDQGTWEGIWVGKARSATYWSYAVVLHGTGGLDGMYIRAEGVWRAGVGDRLDGEIVEVGRRP